MRTLLVASVTLTVAAAIVGSAQTPDIRTPDDGEATELRYAQRDPRYRLQLSDELDITFRMVPDFNQHVAIQPDGFISLREVDDIKALGLTIDELLEELSDRYSAILKAPLITVNLVKFTKPYFIVGGEVSNPGRFDLEGDLTATDAIAIAGGFTLGSRTTEVLLFRHVSPDLVEVKHVDAKRALSGDVEGDLALRSGDAVFVPRSKVGKLDRFMNVSRIYYLFRLPYF